MMASSQSPTSTQVDLKFERKWVISNWVEVQKSEELVRSQTFEFEIENFSFSSKWKVGLDIVRSSGNPMVQPYLKLQELTGPYCKLDITFDAIILGDTPPKVPGFHKVEQTLCVGGVVWRKTNMWAFDHSYLNGLEHIYPDGAVTILIILSVPFTTSPIDKFNHKSLKSLSKNLANLLNDPSLADLKIVTSDQQELLAHKVILKTQNEVFSTMFESEFSENSTGTIRVDDITGKTLKILLHYFYTGQLLPDWQDDDTIVEFTYAAEKYQLTHILQLLDTCLGQRDSKCVSQVDVQLLNLASKINLKTSESILFERIVKAISNVSNAADLFSIIDYHEVVDAPNGDEEFANIFRIFNSILIDEDSSEFSTYDFCLLALAKRFSMNNVESKLLQKLKKAAKILKTPAELSKLFEVRNKADGQNENMLVLAYPDK